MSTESRLANKNYIEGELEKINRLGIDQLIEWLDAHGAYSDPASAKYHSNFPGGWAEHTVKVLKTAHKLADTLASDIDRDSLTLCCIAHDLCKLGTYETYVRNVQVQPRVWDHVTCYKYNEAAFNDILLNHGVQSAWMLSEILPISGEEFMAIANHMGGSDGEKQELAFRAFHKSKIACILHLADIWATSQLEVTYHELKIPWD